MQTTIISGTIQVPQKPQQTLLHRQLAEFINRIQRPKDANEVKEDKRMSVPAVMLPMVF